MAGKSPLDIPVTHVVKENAIGDVLYRKVEPQPPKDAVLVEFPSLDCFVEELRNKMSWFVPDNNALRPCNREDAIPTPISLGDTVYQGHEWGVGQSWGTIRNPKLTKKYFLKEGNEKIKTVFLPKDRLGVWRAPETMPIELADKTYKVVGIDTILSESKWLWKYNLKEINKD